MSMRNPNGFIRPGYDPLQVADAPTAVTPTAGSEAASVDFTPPSNVGGAAVSEYYAVVQPGNITATSVTPPVAVSGLTNGTEYTTKVWANNSYGPSPYSAESSGFTPVPPNVEDVFSTYLYTGNSSTQAINNGIDLDGEGGLVWTKARGVNAESALIDTERGQGNYIPSNATSASAYYSDLVTGFTSTGYTLGADVSRYIVNKNAYTYASWTFRKAPKFFDVVTYTWTGVARTIAHSLESTPACIFIKRTDVAGEWRIWNSNLSTPNTQLLYLNRTDAVASTSVWSTTSPTDTEFSLNNASSNNASGGTFVAYLFASNAGGFGDDGTENVISCGSYTGTGGTTTPLQVTLGYEPQWVLVKPSSGVGNWAIADTMRGMTRSSNGESLFSELLANTSGSENGGNYGPAPTATGFAVSGSGFPNASGTTYIYIAIRRPMKTPESGTEVFNSELVTATQATKIVTGIGFSPDLLINGVRSNANYGQQVTDRLRGVNKQLFTEYTSSESTTNGTALVSLDMDGFTLGADTGGTGWNAYSGFTSVKWAFKRAPGFMDVVCYTGTGGATTIAHNLQAVPQLILVKQRTASPAASPFTVYSATLGNTGVLFLNSDGGNQGPDNQWNSTTPTSSVFSLGSNLEVNYSGSTFVAYLFATLAGVSKVGSYTGTGADLNVDCGFTSGARFVLIKRSGTGDWYVWDSARGIVSGNDPYLLLNSAAAEVTSTDYIDPLASGFTVTSSAPAALNASGGSYIFLAIA